MGKAFAVLIGMAPQLFAYFLSMFGRKYTVATATVLAYIATTVAMIVCLKQILAGVVALIVMPTWIASFIAWFIPSNSISVISAILSGRICKTAYRMVVAKIELVNNAS